MIALFGVKLINRIEDTLFTRLVNCLPEKKQKKLRRFLKWESAQTSLLADMLIRVVLYRKLGLSRDIQFYTNQYGKPLLKNDEDFHFNLSHSGQWIVCAIDDAPIGIDVERIQPMELDIAKRFFSKEEHQDLIAKPAEKQNDYFFDLWTLKESYIKAVGMGLSMPLSSFTMKYREDGGIWVKTENAFRDCFFKQYAIDEGYKMSVCAGKSYFPGNVDILQLEDLCKEFLNIYENN